jgi:hypothetical protein
VTGTAGWEALFAEKPVLLFGYFFYQYASGVFTIDTVEDAKSAVNKIVEGFRPTVRDLRRFHRAVQDTAVRAYADEFYKPVSSVTPEQNAKNLAAALITQLAPARESAARGVGLEPRCRRRTECVFSPARSSAPDDPWTVCPSTKRRSPSPKPERSPWTLEGALRHTIK